jgi:hypothetical protein
VFLVRRLVGWGRVITGIVAEPYPDLTLGDEDRRPEITLGDYQVPVEIMVAAVKTEAGRDALGYYQAIRRKPYLRAAASVMEAAGRRSSGRGGATFEIDKDQWPTREEQPTREKQRTR